MNIRRLLTQSLSLVIVLTLILSNISLMEKVFAGGSFESNLAKFPDSYKSALIKLHEQYPDWNFEPIETGLSFYDAVKAETGKISLVSNSSIYSNMLKSKNTGDYNYSTGAYIQKDAGFVTANSYTVAHFLDPRNFLTVQGIFQFEKLSYDSSVTIEDIEKILSGSFMADAYANYYDTEGNYVTVKKKYSQIFLAAGKKYNINPCFLASRTINEVGRNGSGSTSGKNSTYPGIYNFFNVWANDGTNPTLTGLAKASTGTTYGRPWTSPEKAIMGGAEFNATSYINKGQYTPYLQRFNVDPDAYCSTYSHQYMTNISSPAATSYSTWKGYYNAGTLDHKRVFSIPVYEDMPCLNDGTDILTYLDGQNMTGTMNATCNVRSEPSVYSDKITSISSGTTVSILSIEQNITTYPDSFLCYPFWAKVQFTASSKSYTGYVYFNFINLTTTVNVTVGTYTPVYAKSNSSLGYKYISNDARYATITDDNKINFLKTGSVVIYAYDSMGHFSAVKYNIVSSTSGQKVSGITAKVSSSTASISYTANTKCKSYRIYVLNSKGALVYNSNTTKTGLFVTKLSKGTYSLYVQGVSGNTVYPISSAVSFTIKSSSVTTTSATTTAVSTTKSATTTTAATTTAATTTASSQVALSSVRLSKPVIKSAVLSSDLDSIKIKWNSVANADGYKVYVLDSDTGKYSAIGTTKSTSCSYCDEAALSTATFKVKAYKKVDGSTIYSESSDAYAYKCGTVAVSQVTGMKVSARTANSVTLKWNKVNGATSYLVYKYDTTSKKYVQVNEVTSNSCTVSSLKTATSYKFRVKAVALLYGKTFKGTSCSTFTATTSPKTPTGLKVSKSGKNSVTLSWSKVSSATGYRVYMLNSSTGKYVKVKTVSTASCTVKNLTANTKYTFVVKSYYKTTAGEVAFSPKSNTLTARTSK